MAFLPRKEIRGEGAEKSTKIKFNADSSGKTAQFRYRKGKKTRMRISRWTRVPQKEEEREGKGKERESMKLIQPLSSMMAHQGVASKSWGGKEKIARKKNAKEGEVANIRNNVGIQGSPQGDWNRQSGRISEIECRKIVRTLERGARTGKKKGRECFSPSPLLVTEREAGKQP